MSFSTHCNPTRQCCWWWCPGSRLWDKVYGAGCSLGSIFGINIHGREGKEANKGVGNWATMQAQQQPQPIPMGSTETKMIHLVCPVLDQSDQAFIPPLTLIWHRCRLFWAGYDLVWGCSLGVSPQKGCWLKILCQKHSQQLEHLGSTPLCPKQVSNVTEHFTQRNWGTNTLVNSHSGHILNGQTRIKSWQSG